MLRIFLGIFLTFLVQSVNSDNCSDRMVIEASLIYPRAHSGWEVLANGNVCTVYLSYSLSENGLPGEIRSYVEVEGCKMFSHSAEKALKRSIFGKGQFESGCEHEFNFKFEE